MSKDDRVIAKSGHDQNDRDRPGSDLLQGHHLRDLRMAAGIALEDLAEQTGVTSIELLAMETGSMHIRKAQALRLAGALGLHYSDLWLRDDS